MHNDSIVDILNESLQNRVSCFLNKNEFSNNVFQNAIVSLNKLKRFRELA